MLISESAFDMFALCLVVSLCCSIVVGQLSTTMPEAVVYALTSSINRSANRLDIATQTDFNENKVVFLDLLDGILKEKWSFPIQLNVDNDGYQCAGDYNLWFVDSYEAFSRLLPAIHAYKGNGPVFYFIVLRISTLAKSENLVQKILSDMFHLMIVNVNILTETDADEVLFYTFFPYRESACRSTKPVLLNRYVNKTMASENLFPPKADNLHGCPVRVAAKNLRTSIQVYYNNGRRRFSGFEGEVLNGIAAGMNCTFEIDFSTTNRDSLTNETATGNYKKLLEGQVDFLISFYPYDELSDLKFTASVPYIFTYVVIAIHSPPYKFSKWGWLFGTFDVTVWICFWIFFAVAAAGLVIAKRNAGLRRLFRLQGNRFGILNIVEITLGMSVNNLPSMNFLRFCFIVASMGLLVLRTGYQGKLFDSYCRMDAPKSPQTVEELVDQQYTIYTNQKITPIVKYLSGYRNVTIRTIQGFDVLTSDSKEKVAVILTMSHIMSNLNRTELEAVVINKLYLHHSGMLLQKHSIMAPKVNKILLRMNKAGLTQYLGEKYQFTSNVRAKPKEAFLPKSITLSQFQYALYIFAWIYVLSILVFIVELLSAARLKF